LHDLQQPDNPVSAIPASTNNSPNIVYFFIKPPRFYLQQALPHLQLPDLHEHLSPLHLQLLAAHFIEPLHLHPAILHFEHLPAIIRDPSFNFFYYK